MEAKQTLLAAGMAVTLTSGAGAFEAFDESAGQRWMYVQDGVMGGVSKGAAQLDDGAVRMVGTVSTANNGGFIQIRTDRFTPWPGDAEGLTLEVRGNGEEYYVFLRTPNLRRFGWSYRATFQTSDEWQVVELPFAAFAPSSAGMPQEFTPNDVTSLGIVAYGRDHEADLSVREITLY